VLIPSGRVKVRNLSPPSIPCLLALSSPNTSLTLNRDIYSFNPPLFYFLWVPPIFGFVFSLFSIIEPGVMDFPSFFFLTRNSLFSLLPKEVPSKTPCDLFRTGAAGRRKFPIRHKSFCLFSILGSFSPLFPLLSFLGMNQVKGYSFHILGRIPGLRHQNTRWRAQLFVPLLSEFSFPSRRAVFAPFPGRELTLPNSSSLCRPLNCQIRSLVSFIPFTFVSSYWALPL